MGGPDFSGYVTLLYAPYAYLDPGLILNKTVEGKLSALL